MKTPPKQVLIAGGIAVALGGIYLVRKKEQASAEEFIPTTGPTTYVGSQEAAGNFGNYGGGGGTGGGVPSAPATGVTTVPPPKGGCPDGTYAIGISSIAGKPGGVRCVKNPPAPRQNGGCPDGTYAIGISAIAGKPGGVRCVPSKP